jgi:hypothetical protein
MTNLPASIRKPGPTLAPALSRMELRLPEDSFLLSRFEEFYQELVKLKSELAGHARRTGAAAREAQQRLVALLERQENEVARTGTLLGMEMYRQARRVMACLADEIFQAYSWPENFRWPSLESELFQGEPGGLSQGGQCLRKLNQLLRQDDPVYRELAAVYFYALALSGKDEPEITSSLATLGEIVSPSADSFPLFPQSYAHTLAENKMVLLPAPKKWLWIGASILLAWLVLSWGLWIQVSADVRSQLNEIREILRP